VIRTRVVPFTTRVADGPAVTVKNEALGRWLRSKPRELAGIACMEVLQACSSSVRLTVRASRLPQRSSTSRDAGCRMKE